MGPRDGVAKKIFTQLKFIGALGCTILTLTLTLTLTLNLNLTLTLTLTLNNYKAELHMKTTKCVVTGDQHDGEHVNQRTGVKGTIDVCLLKCYTPFLECVTSFRTNRLGGDHADNTYKVGWCGPPILNVLVCDSIYIRLHDIKQ